MKLIYLSSPYTNGGTATLSQMRSNVFISLYYATKIWRMGAACICAVANSYFDYLYRAMGKDCGVPYDKFIEGDKTIISRCDAIVFLPGWESSKGCQEEFRHAALIQIPVFYSLKELELWLKTH